MKFILCVILAAIVGSVSAFQLNYNRYGYREARFGPFEPDGEVTIENLGEYVNLSKGDKQKLGRIELLDDAKFDFGVMPPDTEGEHTFRVRNGGEGDLTLRVGASTCKCTIGELDKSVLAPGEETEVKLTWTTKVGTRNFNQSAQLLSDDPTDVAITLAIVGRVVSDFELVPEVWTFDDVAVGEEFEVSGELYNFSSTLIEPAELRFSSDELSGLAEFDVQKLERNEFGEGQKAALQAFRVTAKVAPGLRQGVVSQNLLFHFRALADAASSGEKKPAGGDDSQINDSTSTKLDLPVGEDGTAYVPVATRGRVVGPIRMLESAKLKGNGNGGYHYKFGRIPPGGSLKAKTFVVLGGKQRDTTALRVGETFPADVVKATLGEPLKRKSMVLFPLTIELIPGEKPIERLGKSKEDYGKLWIESDNPEVGKMGIVLTFGIGAR